MLYVKGDPSTGRVSVGDGAELNVFVEAENVSKLVALLILAASFVQAGKTFPPSDQPSKPVTFN